MESKGKSKKTEKQEETGWQYKPGAGAAAASVQTSADAPPEPDDASAGIVEWTASEFAAHEKGFGWYVLLAVGAAGVAALIYFATRDVISAAVVLIMAVIFGVAGSRKPRVVAYKVDAFGLTVGSKLYPYSDYKAFSMPQEGPFTTIILVPMRHLAFPVGAYLAPDSQDQVLEILSTHLPLERSEPSTIDQLMHRLRF